MGVDPRKPLVGFALVAVLCAVLMGVSVGRGYSVDLFHPGRPIAPSAAAGGHGGHVDRAPAPAETAEPDAGRVAPRAESVPAVLVPAPIGVGAGSASVTSLVSRSSVVADAEDDADDTSGHAAEKAKRKAEHAADKAERKAEHAADKAERKAGHAADKAERKAEHAADKEAKAAQKAARNS